MTELQQQVNLKVEEEGGYGISDKCRDDISILLDCLSDDMPVSEVFDQVAEVALEHGYKPQLVMPWALSFGIDPTLRKCLINTVNSAYGGHDEGTAPLDSAKLEEQLTAGIADLQLNHSITEIIKNMISQNPAERPGREKFLAWLTSEKNVRIIKGGFRRIADEVAKKAYEEMQCQFPINMISDAVRNELLAFIEGQDGIIRSQIKKEELAHSVKEWKQTEAVHDMAELFRYFREALLVARLGLMDPVISRVSAAVREKLQEHAPELEGAFNVDRWLSSLINAWEQAARETNGKAPPQTDNDSMTTVSPQRKTVTRQVETVPPSQARTEIAPIGKEKLSVIFYLNGRLLGSIFILHHEVKAGDQYLYEAIMRELSREAKNGVSNGNGGKKKSSSASIKERLLGSRINIEMSSDLMKGLIQHLKTFVRTGALPGNGKSGHGRHRRD